jgi:hypothetical protein
MNSSGRIADKLSLLVEFVSGLANVAPPHEDKEIKDEPTHKQGPNRNGGDQHGPSQPGPNLTGFEQCVFTARE